MLFVLRSKNPKHILRCAQDDRLGGKWEPIRASQEERTMNRNPVVAVVGATGAVGVEFLKCFEHRNFPVKELRLLASARSAGKQMTLDRKSTRLNSSHVSESRMPSSA